MGWIKRRINKENSKHCGRLDWSLIAEKKIIATILDWCYKNNTVPMKDIFKGIENSKLKLASLDGGWVNVLKLKDFLDRTTKKLTFK